MKKITCDFCENKNDFRGVSFEYLKFSVILPRWSMLGIRGVKIDLCAFCYKKCFSGFYHRKMNEFIEKSASDPKNSPPHRI